MQKNKARQKWLFDLLKTDPARTYINTLKIYKEKYNLSENTFVNDWKQANKDFQIWQNKVNSEVQKKEIQMEVEARKDAILNKIDALGVLSQIAQGQPIKKDNEKHYPSFKDQINAISLISKLEGWEFKETQAGSIDITSWIKNNSQLVVKWDGV